jgi:hypothetical protein
MDIKDLITVGPVPNAIRLFVENFINIGVYPNILADVTPISS